MYPVVNQERQAGSVALKLFRRALWMLPGGAALAFAWLLFWADGGAEHARSETEPTGRAALGLTLPGSFATEPNNRHETYEIFLIRGIRPKGRLRKF